MKDTDLDDRIYLELRLSKAIETDAHGNWIIEAEASNENLDFDGQVVLQRALSGSKDYFLANGVISYDHRHLRADPEDPNWSPEKYIIGEPMGVTTRGGSTFVKAKLYKSNEVAREIVKKLQDGSTRMKTSVGGKRPEVVSSWDQKLGRAVEKVVRVLWDELAITFKPVNQTLEPVALSSAAFVKSLEAGFGTDSATMTGGRATIPSDLKTDESKKDIYALAMGLTYKDVQNEKQATQFLINRGCTPEKAKAVIRYVISQKDPIKEEISMDANLIKSFEESILTLEKSMKKPAKGAVEPDGDEDMGKGFTEFPPKDAIEGNDEPDPDEELDEDGNPIQKPAKRVEKSLYNELKDTSSDFLDVTPFLDNLAKSISRRMSAMEKQVTEMVSFQKSMGGALVATGNLVKSLGDSPMPRQATVNKQERSFTGSDGKVTTMTKSQMRYQVQKGFEAGKISLQDMSKMEDRINKGIAISEPDMIFLKSL